MHWVDAAVHLLLAQQGCSIPPQTAQMPATPVAAPWQIMSAVSHAAPLGDAEARQHDSPSLPHVQRPPVQMP